MKNYILFLFLGLTGIINAQDILLDVSHVAQGNTEWCSTAAAKCILDYYGKKLPNGKPITQCVIMDEYIRKICNSHGGTNGYGCCLAIPGVPMQSHPCNKGVNLGVFNERASVKGILMHFGDIPCIGFEHAQNTYYIEQSLIKNNLMVAQWNYYYPSYGDPDAHTVVIRGVKKSTVYYMDPAPAPPNGKGGLNALSFAEFQDNLNIDDYEERKHWWAQTLTLTDCSGRDLPCHCYNGEWDQHLNEQGVDCGGSCEPCAPPDCFNCLKSPDEQEIDCGGPNCPPCEDVPLERTITSYLQLRSEIMAFNKITAQNFAIIKSGEKVRFITSDTGSIVLLPGFHAERGSTFTTQRKDLSGSGRICGTICGKWWVPSSCLPNGDGLYVHDLQYANKIVYDIYNPYGQSIIHKEKIVSHNGSVFLCYTPINTTNITYTIILDSYHCDGSKRRYGREFTAIGYSGGKSSTDEPENPDTYSSPPNNISTQEENPTPIFSIIPNPNPGTFQIETNFSLSDIANLKITNSLGAPVYETQSLFSNTIQLPTSTSGLHLVVAVLKDGTVLTQKMMLQR